MAPNSIIQAATVSGGWRAKSGFCRILAIGGADGGAEDQDGAAVRSLRPPSPPDAMSATPAKETRGARPRRLAEPLAEQDRRQDRGQDRADLDDEARRAARDGQLAEVQEERVERDEDQTAGARRTNSRRVGQRRARASRRARRGSRRWRSAAHRAPAARTPAARRGSPQRPTPTRRSSWQAPPGDDIEPFWEHSKAVIRPTP